MVGVDEVDGVVKGISDIISEDMGVMVLWGIGEWVWV
jgi:hypothetical protein